MSTIEVQIPHNANDGNQNLQQCTTNWGTAGPVLMWQGSSIVWQASGWFHFENVTVPQGSNIDHTDFIFHAGINWTDANLDTLFLRVEDHPNPDRPLNSSLGPCARDYFGAVKPTKLDLVSGEQWTEDITDLIAHVVALPDYGEHQVQILYEAGWGPTNTFLNIHSHDNGSADAARMRIDYSGDEPEPGGIWQRAVAHKRAGVVRQ